MALAVATALTNSLAQLMRSFKGGKKWTLRAAAVLTDTYVDSSHMPCDLSATIGVWITCASVDYTSIEVRYEGSYDGTTFFSIPAREVFTSSSHVARSWVDSFVLASFPSATATKVVVQVSVPGGVRYFRVSIKRTGGTAVGTVLVEGIEGGNS